MDRQAKLSGGTNVNEPRSNPSRVSRPVTIAFAILAGFALLALSFAPRRLSPDRPHLAVGSALPGLDLVSLTPQSAALGLDELHGKIVLLNFWGTWCGPCQEEFPHLERLAKKYAAHGDFRLVSVSCEGGPDEDLDTLHKETLKYLEQAGSSITTYADPSGETRRAVAVLTGEMQFSYPTTLVLDRDGTVQGLWQGYAPQTIRHVDRVLQRLLSDRS